MSWLSALIWVNDSHFFPWEPLDILFQNLMGRLFSMKGSDCAIFHIFLGTFGCAHQKFQDYFCILTFPLQWLMRLGWNLARSFSRCICTFSGHFPSHQWISIFISGLWLSTTVAPRLVVLVCAVRCHSLMGHKASTWEQSWGYSAKPVSSSETLLTQQLT